MEILQIAGLGVVASVLSVMLKNHRPEISIQISIAAGIIIFFLVAANLAVILGLVEELSAKLNMDMVYLNTILKIMGIAYVAEFGAEICRDAGEGAIASKIEFAGKALILAASVPIIVSLLQMLVQFLP